MKVDRTLDEDVTSNIVFSKLNQNTDKRTNSATSTDMNVAQSSLIFIVMCVHLFQR